MHFHRSWMSTGRAVRLVQMMGLHCMDGKDSDLWPLPLPKTKDWTAKEERRRTFWMAFCLDRYASIGHGWPMTVDDKDVSYNIANIGHILTNLAKDLYSSTSCRRSIPELY